MQNNPLPQTIFMFESKDAVNIRNKLENDPLLPTMDLLALDAVILELAYYDPFQSAKDIVDHLVDNELISDRLVPHSITSKMVVELLQPYVEELKISLLSHMGKSDFDIESQRDVRFISHQYGWYILGVH
jgi:hypothetical protein